MFIFFQLEYPDVMQVLHKGLFVEEDMDCVDSYSCKASL